MYELYKVHRAFTAQHLQNLLGPSSHLMDSTAFPKNHCEMGIMAESRAQNIQGKDVPLMFKRSYAIAPGIMTIRNW
jgi:hypothetical protein